MAKAKSASRGVTLPEQVVMNPENVRPVYSNWVQVAVTDTEFRIVFGEILERSKTKLVARELTRIYVTPKIAKAMADGLTRGVERYEAANGPIIGKTVVTKEES